ncbi:MAG: GNAT family N-acetyltransferase [Thermomicrobiales bacterium]
MPFIDALHPDDVNACMALAHTLPEWFGNADGLRQMRTSLHTDRGFVIREADDALIGFVTMTHPFPATWEIAWLAVAPSQHRRGLGRTLIDAVVKQARAEGGCMLVVKTLSAAHPSPEYAATRAFYARLGFLPIAEVPEHWGPENPCLILARPL